MKKLTFLLSALFIALASVFAQDQDPAKITLTPDGDTQIVHDFYTGQTENVNGFPKATIALTGNVDKDKLQVEVKGDPIFSAKFNGDKTELEMEYHTQYEKDTTYLDTVIVWEDGTEVADSLFYSIHMLEKTPAPITVDPKSWTIDALPLGEGGTRATTKQHFTYEAASGAEVSIHIQAEIDAFLWDPNDSTLSFAGETLRTYTAEVTFSTENPADEAVTVPVSITVVEPKVEQILSIEKSGAQAFETKEIVRAQEGLPITDTIWSAISTQGIDLADLKIKKLNEESIFSADFEEGKGRFFIAYEASAAVDNAQDTIVVYVENTELSDSVFVSLTVNEIVPEIQPSASVMAWGDVEFADAKAGVDKAITVVVTQDAELSWAIAGAQKDNFAVTLADGTLSVTFTAAAAGEYAATITLSAPGAENKTITLSATVLEEPLADPTNCAEAREAALSVSKNNELYNGGKEYSIPGYVTEIAYAWKDGSMSFWMADTKDGGKVLEAYKCAIEKQADAVEVGDSVKVTGKLTKYNTTPEFTAGCTVEIIKRAPATPTTTISLDKTEAELKVGKTLRLTVTRDGTDELTWASSDAKIASVAEGVVTAVAVGEATITATANGKSATCKVTVVEPSVGPAAGEWVADPAVLKAGDIIIIANLDHSYALSNEQVNQSGKAVFRLAKEFDESNISDEFEKIELVASGNNFKLKVADGFLYFDSSWATNNKNWMGTNETGSDFNFVQSGDTIFIVEQANNRIMLYNYNDGNSPRFAIYKQTSSLRSKGSVAIFRLGEVEEKETTFITLDPTAAELEAGKTLKLKVDRDGNDELTWKSSNEAVATVANGVVTGVAEGEATITATANGISATCKVTVTPAIIVPSAGEWVADPSILKAGDKIVITNYAKTKAMSTTQTTVEGKSYYRGETDFDETNISDEVEQVELVASGNNFKLKVTGGFLYFDPEWMTAGQEGKKQNWLGTNETGTDFRFELSGDTVFIANDYGYIFHNAQSTRFAHYVGTSSMRKNASAVFLLGEQQDLPTTRIVVEPDNAEIKVGKTLKLSVRRDGNDELTWASSNEAVATVANGVVTGIAAGEAIITATANGKSATCKVTVIEAVVGDITNCAEAAEAALSVSENNELYNDGAEYTIQGYVTEIAYTWSKGSMSFWMADTKDGGKVLEAYKCAIEKEEDAVHVGDLVNVTGKLTKYNKTPEFAAGCTVEIVERAEYVEPKNLGEKTIAEFLELKNTIDTCILTGVVDSIKNTQFGNLYISQDGASLYIYGLLTPDGQTKQFESLDVAVGDTLTIKATYNEFNEKPQAKNAIYVSNKKAGETPGPGPDPDPDPDPEPEGDLDNLEIEDGMAFRYEDEYGLYWEIVAGKVDEETEDWDYPIVVLQIDNTDSTHLAGHFELFYGVVYLSENDSIEFEGMVDVTYLETTPEGRARYKFAVEGLDDNFETITFEFETEITAIDGMESTELEPIFIELQDGGDQAIENTEFILDTNAPIYNIQGMQVGRQQGVILIQDGHKFMIAQ